ncbi:MAG: polymer-forming cytoskeletal protein [Chloroflexi bacterium]|nr:polymer-forming cytoskeletal protein [Chloroflexota bacterium]
MDDRVMKILRQTKRVFSGKESGFAFTAVLTFLILGAIVIGPLLGFMITGLRAQQSHEQRTTELYSADAGVEYAVWQLQNGGLLADDGTANFTGTRDLDPFEVNGDNVTVSVENENDEGVFFKVVSDARDLATGSMTRVRARVTPTYGYQGNFFANGITGLDDVDMYGECNGDVQCEGTLTIYPGQIIRGDVMCGRLYSKGIIYGDVHCRELDNRGTIYGNVEYTTLQSMGTVIGTPTAAPPPDFTDLEESWPREEYLTSFYLDQVPSSNFPSTIVNTCGSIGPLYMGYTNRGAARDLTIDTKTQACEVRLNDTIFVTGDFEVTPRTLVNLNGQTIYCLGDVDFAPGSRVKGSGLIIAVGTVFFHPNIVAGDDASAILRYNGSVWSKQTSPASADLKDVWGASATSVFAVGQGGTILVTSNGGAAWTAMTSNTGNNLSGIWGAAANDIYTSGGRRDHPPLQWVCLECYDQRHYQQPE